MAHAATRHSDAEHSARLEATQARQGSWDRDVLLVLAVSTLLAAIVLFGLWALNAPDFAAAEAQQAALAESSPPAP